MNFADVEKNYLWKMGLPDFEWTTFGTACGMQRKRRRRERSSTFPQFGRKTIFGSDS